MARYTNIFVSVLPANNLRESLPDVLQSCGLHLVYQDGDYMMAKERPGLVSFSKLATVEVLIGSTDETELVTQHSAATVNLVVKNEELPLQVNNHCHKVFQQVNQALESKAG
ncbi:hypothetical protein D0962_25815 [Leptolyngbyaceae cyanobacterium CCMR0082]|uniref:Uncharacterized protein n=2 Tax=Adonisia turfae TaxID=2950184 RepID=A0A6M0SCC6_9CYAN|nr:hypothetical protein [Adonisia turfae]EKV01149.1 hypothetical protein Lepto7375DRAFT_3292 [Leptolyngbya sp. PCC 7375]NEZ59815.1 hypothetical protein [Adonisia turfae CCMR0081]NEZ66138.1 hypothetical protein [Adonisia turfae CCMR0082]